MMKVTPPIFYFLAIFIKILIDMKVSGKVFGFLFSVAVGFAMFLAMSFFMLVVNVGLIDGFFFIWMQSFLVGFIISIPIAMRIANQPKAEIPATEVY